MDRVIDRVCLAVAILAVIFEQGLFGLYDGYAIAAERVCEYTYKEGLSFGIMDGGPYLALHNSQVFFAYAILLFLLLKLIERGLITRIAGLLIVGYGIFSWHSIYARINDLTTDADKYLDIVRITNHYPKLVLGLIVAAALLQICSIVICLYKPKQPLQ